MTDEPRKRGRATKRDEARDYLTELGLDPDALDRLEAGESDVMPADPQEVIAAFMQRLWSQRDDMKGIALVNAFKALAQVAQALRPPENEDEKQVGLDDLLASAAGLPGERRLALVAAAIDETEQRLHNLKALRAEVTGDDGRAQAGSV